MDGFLVYGGATNFDGSSDGIVTIYDKHFFLYQKIVTNVHQIPSHNSPKFQIMIFKIS